MKPARIAIVFLIVALTLSACNLPSEMPTTEEPNLLSTTVAQTLQAQLTSQAMVASPTSQAALPTNTQAPGTAQPTLTVAPPTANIASATPNCNAAQFVTDVTIPDGTILEPNEVFTKTWRLKNSGTCSWTPAYAAVFSSGNPMNGPATQALAGNVNPGQTIDLSINFKAPASVGDYSAYYKLRDAGGVLFAQFYVQIKVRLAGDDGDDTEFAVIHVTFSEQGGCGNFKATANITVNGPGTVKYHWVWSDHATDTVDHPPLVFTAAGTQSVSYQWNSTTSGLHWIDIYIDQPNHQKFGRANFHCP